MPTLVFAREHWADAPAADDKLGDLLDAATEQVAEFAPALAEGEPTPTRYLLAVVYQARELANAATRQGDVIASPDAYPLRARPLTGAVKALLRPPSGTPVVG